MDSVKFREWQLTLSVASAEFNGRFLLHDIYFSRDRALIERVTEEKSLVLARDGQHDNLIG
jgi:hypothetical protein